MARAGPGHSPPGAPFSYARSVAPMLWVLLCLSGIEVAVVHLLLGFWSVPAALILSGISLTAMIWLILFIRSLSHCPVRVGPDGLVWRCGFLRRLDVPIDAIIGIRSEWDGALLKSRATFNAALVAYPNILIAIDPPVAMGRRQIGWLAHRLDDPQAFAVALNVLLRRP